MEVTVAEVEASLLMVSAEEVSVVVEMSSVVVKPTVKVCDVDSVV